MAIAAFARAPFASDPARSRGRRFAEPRERHPQRLPPRLRPNHPFDRVPAARPQDPGVRVPRGRSFPHPPDAHPGGDPDRPLARPRARARRGPGRGLRARPRPRPSAVRPRRRARARSLPRGVRRLRPQRADAARGDGAGAALRRLRRAQSHLGDARRPGQAQRPAHRPRRASGRALSPSAACRAPSPTIRAAHDLELWSYPSAEAQCGAIADDIAYDAHDIDDGLRAEMFRIEELAGLPLLDDILREIAAQHPRLEPGRRAHELIRRLITRMIEDVIAQSRAPHRRARAGIGRTRCATPAGRSSAFPRRWREADRAIKDFLYPRLYRHARIMRIMGEAEEVVRRLFAHYVADAGRPAGRLAGRARAGRCHGAARCGSPISSPA